MSILKFPIVLCQLLAISKFSTALRNVTVSTSSELQSALDNAAPGDRILLAQGDYPGQFNLTANGTEDNPIILTTEASNATFKGLENGENVTALTATGSHWILQYFAVMNYDTGIVVNGTGVKLDALAISNINTGVVLNGVVNKMDSVAITNCKKVGVIITAIGNTLETNSIKSQEKALIFNVTQQPADGKTNLVSKNNVFEGDVVMGDKNKEKLETGYSENYEDVNYDDSDDENGNVYLPAERIDISQNTQNVTRNDTAATQFQITNGSPVNLCRGQWWAPQLYQCLFVDPFMKLIGL